MAVNTTAKQLEAIEKMEASINRLGDLLERVAKMQETAANHVVHNTARPSYNRPQRVVKSEAEVEKTHGPWRCAPEDFLALRDEIEASKHNLAVAKLLAMHLDRGTGIGPVEGQLYINWRKEVGQEGADAWWMQFNGKPAPKGL